MIKKLIGINIFTTGEGKRVAGTYSELSEDGKLLAQNKKVNFIILDDEVLKKVEQIEKYVQEKIEGE